MTSPMDFSKLLGQAPSNDTPCDCPLVDEPTIGPHTEYRHRRESCGGISQPEPCGGCFDCVLAQMAHADYLSKTRGAKS